MIARVVLLGEVGSEEVASKELFAFRDVSCSVAAAKFFRISPTIHRTNI